MHSSSQEVEGKKKITEVKTFPIPFVLGEIKENISIATNTPSKPSKEQIINQAFKFHSQGNISEAAKYYQYFINQGFKDHRVFSNYGVISNDLGNLQDAELSYRKAIEIKPGYAEAHSNLGNTLIDLGKLKESILCYEEALNLDNNLDEAKAGIGRILLKTGKLREGIFRMREAYGSINFNYKNSNIIIN